MSNGSPEGDKLQPMDPLSLLRRDDKWFLAGGNGALYAPPFPKWLSKIGFWDECFLADIRLPRLFTALLADDQDRPVALEGRVIEWRPDRLVVEHVGGGTRLRETRLVTGTNAFVSQLELLEGSSLHLFLWSLLDLRSAGFGSPWQSVADVADLDGALGVQWATAWPSELRPDRTGVETEQLSGSAAMLPPLAVHLCFGASSERISSTVNLVQRHDESPLWATSLLPQKLREGRLGEDRKLWVGTEPIEGLVHLVQQYRLEPGVPIRLVCGTGFDGQDALSSLETGLRAEVVSASEESWRRYFAGVPQFASSDPFLTAAYWYRWYGLRLNTVSSMPSLDGEAYHPYVTEGIGFFRNFVTYSAQAHLREVSWMHNPSLAVGILDNLTKVQREDGSFPGHNYSCRPSRDFYHADFATGLLQLHRLHPGTVGREHLATLRRYADYFLRYRTTSKDPAAPTLYDVFDQNETGQEYMSRYQFASADADKWQSFRVSGVDATVYAHNLFAILALFRPTDSVYASFGQGARTGLAELAYDREQRFMCDVNQRGDQSPARPATGFYPFLCFDLVGLWADDAVPMADIVDRWLSNPNEFWLASGFPATSASDATYSADGEWKLRRLNCPWNGRSWPMANSHLVDGIGQVARAHRLVFGEETEKQECLQRVAADAFMKSIRLMFHDGDASRPNSYEHYDPESGTAALYRGYDDYMHSWIVDLILRYAVGVIPGEDAIDPLPLDVDWIECTDIPHRKGRMSVRIEKGKQPSAQIS